MPDKISVSYTGEDEGLLERHKELTDIVEAALRVAASPNRCVRESDTEVSVEFLSGGDDIGQTNSTKYTLTFCVGPLQGTGNTSLQAAMRLQDAKHLSMHFIAQYETLEHEHFVLGKNAVWWTMERENVTEEDVGDWARRFCSHVEAEIDGIHASIGVFRINQ